MSKRRERGIGELTLGHITNRTSNAVKAFFCLDSPDLHLPESNRVSLRIDERAKRLSLPEVFGCEALRSWSSGLNHLPDLLKVLVDLGIVVHDRRVEMKTRKAGEREKQERRTRWVKLLS